MPGKEPERVALHQYGRVGGMFVAKEGVTCAHEGATEHIAPLLLHALQFVGGDRNHRAVTGEEVLAEGFGLLGKVGQIVRALELVASAAVEVVHQDVFVAVVEFEYAAALYMRFGAGVDVEVLEVFLVGSCQSFRRGLLDAVLYFLAVSVLRVALVEKVIHAVRIDDVVVDGAVLGGKQGLRRALKGGEVFVGIGVIGNERLALIVGALQGEVDHVLPGLGVVDGLRGPDPVGIAEGWPVLAEVDLRVCPIDQVF
ncbi:MAG: hypothetical protein BWY72_00844 [Bacteroidetes bacterium ADurb.Bin416]|nr:MAG: hypothetical protein BWY72_00844 [Bacteroidetes bacterium ADurb.Bin416]